MYSLSFQVLPGHQQDEPKCNSNFMKWKQALVDMDLSFSRVNYIDLFTSCLPCGRLDIRASI